MKNIRTKSRAGGRAPGRKRSSDQNERPKGRKEEYKRRDAKSFDKEGKPFDRERRPFDRDGKPFKKEGRPFDKERRPFDKERRPFDKERRPFDKERRPFDRDGKPFDKERRPFDKERRPFDKERRPFDRDGKPFDRERKPFDRERRPFDKDGKPFRKEGRPFDKDGKPFKKEGRPFDKERKPFDRERKPFDRDGKPFDKERRPFKTGSAPAYFDEETFKSSKKTVLRERRSKKSSDNYGEDSIRLNKFISNSGICSRREADEYIQAGLITVNGVIITELGVKISYKDDVRFNGERLSGEEKVYILMNKPKDFVTTVSDPNADKTVMDLLKGKCSQRVFPVGRLDKMTTGVLLFTNDGKLAEKLTHPSNKQKKIYHVYLDSNLSKSDFNEILKGITLEDGPIHADALSYVDGDESQVGIEIHSGRNRVVRRLFEHFGYKIKKLDRVYFAGLTKKNLSRGQWRYLTEQEAAMLKMGAYE